MRNTLERKVVATTMFLGDDEINIDAWVSYEIDNHYGEDADGNRASQVVNVVEVENIMAHDVYGNDVELSEQDLIRAEREIINQFFMG